MDNCKEIPVKDWDLDEELADVLTAISIVAKHLAQKIRRTKGGKNGSKVRA